MTKKHIRLIVTGDLEKKSLHKSLAKVFPSRDCNGDDVVWDVPRKAIHGGFTSMRLKPRADPSVAAIRLVDEMFTEALTSKNPSGKPPDLVLVIDDVELGNIRQVEIVADTFRFAVEKKLAQLRNDCSASHYEHACKKIRQSCSFHLLNPMVESYFFADNQVLRNGGLISRLPALLHSTDVEEFDASVDLDPDWSDFCRVANLATQVKLDWWRTELHPKHYLTYLMAASAAPEYHEVTAGARMLEMTDWGAVAKLRSDAPLISALLEDIWDWLGCVQVAGRFVGTASQHTYKVKNTHPQKLLLRNI